jgi:hypothetical protein
MQRLSCSKLFNFIKYPVVQEILNPLYDEEMDEFSVSPGLRVSPTAAPVSE